MNLNRLKVFDTVAKLGSFTQAAQELFLTQPGVSKHIKALEEHYGAPLFDRLGKKIELTQTGELVFESTQEIFRILCNVDKKVEELRCMKGGRILVGASYSASCCILFNVLAKFREEYPEVEVFLDIDLSDVVAEKVISNEIDIGLIGTLYDDKCLISTKIFEDDLVVVIPKTHKWANRFSVEMTDLLGEKLIIANEKSGTREVVLRVMNELGIKFVEFGNTDTIKKAINNNMGISILSRCVVCDEIEMGELIAIDLDGRNHTRNFYSIHRADKYLTIAVEELLNMLRKGVGWNDNV